MKKAVFVFGTLTYTQREERHCDGVEFLQKLFVLPCNIVMVHAVTVCWL